MRRCSHPPSPKDRAQCCLDLLWNQLAAQVWLYALLNCVVQLVCSRILFLWSTWFYYLWFKNNQLHFMSMGSLCSRCWQELAPVFHRITSQSLQQLVFSPVLFNSCNCLHMKPQRCNVHLGFLLQCLFFVVGNVILEMPVFKRMQISLLAQCFGNVSFMQNTAK